MKYENPHFSVSYISFLQKCLTLNLFFSEIYSSKSVWPDPRTGSWKLWNNSAKEIHLQSIWCHLMLKNNCTSRKGKVETSICNFGQNWILLICLYAIVHWSTIDHNATAKLSHLAVESRGRALRSCRILCHFEFKIIRCLQGV